ncbi:NK-tumor recognition protein isoform X4 [Opisthocomus hoazin]|uniref:NK-tumor recognition protein isoform X4 n=1 Tax=Opisthocomus hoazin TaxID=30419 RepID=UPI003F53A5B7
MGVQDRPQCFFEIEINREPVGRIMFQLFSDICPKTCKNFLCLCSGEKGIGKTTGKKLCYKGTTFHRVVKNFMIQGGDFSEGNGKGGESIYGGYFKDENFILKHDRAFLLSMANRGKHTNGSQFFITTKPAPHLDGVHVVFGLVISGFEVIEQIENLKTDTASRPYADVRVIDCGVLVTKSAKDALEKKKKVCSDSEASDSSSSASSSSETSSESEDENERSRRRKRKRRAKPKQSRKRRKEERKKEDPRCKRISNQRRLSDKSDVTEKAVDVSTKRDKPVVRPEEIPPVPENRFLLRRDVPVVNVEPEPKLLDAAPVLTDQKPSVSKSGRKIKGRGTIRYHTPPRSRSCSESDDDESSETPPHWKEEMQRLRTYRPPSGEKWSKGDKLSDPCTSRWDERSVSRRSRSWSHNGYSDLSTVRYSSHHKKHRKEKKKVKHKKKSKKQKHFKKHKQTKKKRTSASSDVESSHSFLRRAKSSCDRERKSRSSSLSSRHSSRRDWSKSDKEDQSSSTLSSRGTRSYYRSRSKSRSRSRSRSYSRRSSRSRSASKSSRSRSRSRSSSNPRQQKTVPNSPRNTSTRLNENKLNKTAEPVRAVILPSEKVVVPPVVPESLPVIPLSDSPPPSRWKPGQKPWKPSYERIQEMKAKTTHLIPTQTNYNLVVIKEANTSSSYSKRQRSSDSDRSGYSKDRSDRSSDSWQRSRSRSSRSRSYSRSYTRSRSPSSSRTRSRSSGRSPSLSKYRSDRSGYSESTSYYSLSDDDRHRNKRKSASNDQKARSVKLRQETSSESTLPYKRAKDYDESSQGLKESDSLSSSDFSTDSERSAKIKVAQEKDRFQLEGDTQKQDKSSLSSERGEEKSKSERDSDHAKKKAGKEKSSKQPRSGAKTRRKSYSGSKWDSESNSERGEARHNRGDSRPSSSKEEGEATSGSDTELSVTRRIKKQSNSSEGLLDSDRTWKTSKQVSSSESDSSCSSSTNIRGKSKKQKLGSKKALKKSHSKKAKEKSKEKKEKKHKVQKRKETFHWQPPLEFGEEDDDEINEKSVTKDEKKEKHLTRDVTDEKQVCQKGEIAKDKMGNGDKSCADENLLGKNTTCDASPDCSNLNKDSVEINASATVLNSGINVTACKTEIKQAEESNQNGLEDVIQTDDNMEICTPDRNSPGKVDVEVLSPVLLPAKPQALSASINKDVQVETSETDTVKLGNNIIDFINMKEEKEMGRQENNSVPVSCAKDCSLKSEITESTQSNVTDNKWKPLQGVGNLQPAAISTAAEAKNIGSAPEPKPAGLRIEIKAKNKVRPGSLFDEVRKTARLNRRPRNQESSSEEESPSRDDNRPSRSLSRSRSKSQSKSRHRTRSISYSHSRSRSRSSTYSYRSRSYTRSRSRGWYSRDRSRSRSSSYHSYKSRSRTYSRSRSRSSSYGHHSRSRSYTYDSYYSRSRSRSKRSDSYRRSRSYDRRSRSYGSDSESDRSYSNNRSPSESSRYS